MQRLPWFRQCRKSEPEPPLRLPISTAAIVDPRRRRQLHAWVYERAERAARRHNVDRREFLASSCGMATTLFALDLINGCAPAGSPATDASEPKTMARSARMPPDASIAAPGDASTPAAPAAPTGPTTPGISVSPRAPAPTSGGDGGLRSDGGFGIPEQACEDEALADLLMGIGQSANSELIVDMQNYFATPWLDPVSFLYLDRLIGHITRDRFPWMVRTAGVTSYGKYDRSEYINQILLGSPTSLSVISGLPYVLGDDGTGLASTAALSNEDLRGSLEYLRGEFPGRVFGQALVMPNDRIDLQLAAMERNAEWCHSWKSVPSYLGSAGVGYRLDAGGGPRMLEKGLELDRPIFSITKGRTMVDSGAAYSAPSDVGAAARMFPNARLVISEAAFEVGLSAPETSSPSDFPEYTDCSALQLGPGVWPEGPYDEGDSQAQQMFPLDRGVNALIRSLRRHNIGPNGRDLDNPSGPVTTHVYAEVGNAWPQLMTSRHDEAMHFWGKLLKHVGEDHVLWGTAGLWYGSPTPIIQAFRCFEISEAFQARYGYPALTAERKRKILGLNAIRMVWDAQGMDMAACQGTLAHDEQLTLQEQLDGAWGPRRDMMHPAPRLSRRRWLGWG